MRIEWKPTLRLTPASGVDVVYLLTGPSRAMDGERGAHLEDACARTEYGGVPVARRMGLRRPGEQIYDVDAATAHC